MLDQIIFQQVSQLTHNGINRGLNEKEAVDQAKKTIDSILNKTKEFITKFKNLNQTLVFQQLSQMAIGKILSGSDPIQSVEEAASTIGTILKISEELTNNSDLLD